jgi:hypothetical protein
MFDSLFAKVAGEFADEHKLFCVTPFPIV